MVDNKKATLGKTCTACGSNRKTKLLGYHPDTLEAFCDNPYICTDAHPNSTANIIKNQKALELISWTDAMTVHKANLIASFDKESVDKIQRLLQYPVTLRIHSPQMAEFIVKLQQEGELKSTSEVVWLALDELMKNKDFKAKVVTTKPTGTVEPQPQQAEPQQAEEAKPWVF